MLHSFVDGEMVKRIVHNEYLFEIPTLETIGEYMDVMTDPEFVSKEEMNKAMAEEFLPMAHKAEVAFYDLFREVQAPFPIPQSWYGQDIAKDHPGVIIMQDFSDDGALVNICDGLSRNQIYQIAEAIAHLHAYSLKNQGKNSLY